MLERWFVGEREQATHRRYRRRRAVQGNLSALDRTGKSEIAEPNPGKGREFSSDRRIDVAARGAA
jgi:hypothetical protein